MWERLKHWWADRHERRKYKAMVKRLNYYRKRSRNNLHMLETADLPPWLKP